MNKTDEKNVMVSIKLMKICGLYQLIDPHTPKYFGFNPFKILATFEILYGIMTIGIICFSLKYYSNNGSELFMTHFMDVNGILLSIYKLLCITNNSDRIWKCFDVTSIHFLSFKNHRKKILRNARAVTIPSLTYFAILWTCFMAFWCLSPFFLKGVYFEVNFKDGIHRYRYNSLNFVYPVTEKFYNENFLKFYIIETLADMFFGHVTLMYFIFVISLCITISFQFKTINDSYSRLCYKPISSNNNEKQFTNNELESINQLKQLIQDQQKLFTKIREVFLILKPATFFEIASESMLIILQSYLMFIKNYDGLPLTSSLNVKMLASVLTEILQLYFTCYLFNSIDDQMELLNFSLYSSDWTGRNIEFKKLLLLTMKMNSANKLQIKISLKRIINVEMFAKVMHTTYSIISVLAKSYGRRI